MDFLRNHGHLVSVLDRSCIMGPRKSRTPPAKESALISVDQQVAPSFSQLITASLSPGLILAFSLKSLGSTICPRSSTLIKDSTLQQFEFFPLPAKQLIFSFLFMAFPPPRHLTSQTPGILFPVPDRKSTRLNSS